MFPVQSDVCICSFRVFFASTYLFAGGRSILGEREGGREGFQKIESVSDVEGVSEGEEVSRGEKERVSEF